MNDIATVFAAVSRIAIVVLLAFVAWLIFAQTPNCPNCGEPIERPSTIE